jgi:hypothetical protein
MADGKADVSVPSWWQFALLVAAAWRVFQLIARDDILDRPRARALGYPGWKEGDDLPESFRPKWSEFITCPYCAGFWIVVVWWIAWQITDHWTLVVAVPFALSAGLVALDKVLATED